MLLRIGEASVKMLAEHGADVSFCARNKEAVDALSSQKIKAGSIKDSRGIFSIILITLSFVIPLSLNKLMS